MLQNLVARAEPLGKPILIAIARRLALRPPPPGGGMQQAGDFQLYSKGVTYLEYMIWSVLG